MRHRRLGVLALVCCLVFVVAGCGDDTPGPGENFSPAHLGRFAAESPDLPSGYTIVKDDRLSAQECREEAETREEADQMERLAALGLTNCYVAVHRKRSKRSTDEVASGGFRFETANGASQALPLVRRVQVDSFYAIDDNDDVTVASIPVRGLGDEAVPGVRHSTDSFSLVGYMWRRRNVVGVVVGPTGSSSAISGKMLLRIAKKIDFRATR